jgi:hypothetical protein
MRIVLGLLLSFVIYSVQGQDITISNNKLLTFLTASTERISTITNPLTYKNTFLKIDKEHLKTSDQILIKNSTGLYILIEGSGVLYKSILQESNTLNFTRIDSTHFYGYNGGCINFSYNDTIYSFGGFGLWRYNGQLRYYSELNNEWNIQKIDKEIPTKNTLYYQDLKDNAILYLQSPYSDPATGKEFDNYTLTKLQLTEKKNLEIGILNPILSILFTKIPEYSFVNIPKLNGTLINFSTENEYLLNYQTNEVYRLVNKNIKDIFFGKSNGMVITNQFAIKDTIYYTKSNDSTYKLYSFPISMNDFVKEPYPLYEPFEDEKKKTYFYIGGLCILLIGGSVFFVKKRKQKTSSTNSEPSMPVFKKEDNGIDFNPLELELITKIIEQSARGNHFSVEDINTSL